MKPSTRSSRWASPIEYAHHEVGPSQHEIDMRFTTRSRWPTTRSRIASSSRRWRRRSAPRDLHAEAALRRERLGDAHAPVPLRRGKQRLLRSPTTSGTSRTSARPSSRVSSTMPARSRRCSPSGSTPTSGSCRAMRRRSTCAWSRRNRSALIRIPLYQPGKRAGDTRGDSLSGSGMQPVPHLRGASPGGT